MIGSIIGGALKIGGAIFGGAKASKAMKQRKRNIEAQRTENRDWYNRRYNEDATQRGDAQRLLTKTGEAIRRRNRQAAGVQAVTGGTEESVAAAKMANSEAMADAASRIVAQADARKDNIEASYRQRNAQLNDQLSQMEYNKAVNTAQAINGVAGAAADIASIF